MHSTRIISFTLCLGLACLLLMGNALAGTTTATEVDYATEVGAAGTTYDLPTAAAGTVDRLMNVLRGTGGDFFVDVTLGDGALWDATIPPDGFELTFTDITPAFYTVTLLGTPAGSATATYSVVVTNGTPVAFPTGTFDGTGVGVEDVNNVLGGGGTISITMSTRDAGTGDPIDTGAETDVWLTSSDAVVMGEVGTTGSGVDAGARTVDVASGRLDFDTAPLNTDATATVAIIANGTSTTPLTNSPADTAYITLGDDSLDLVITGNLTGITTVEYSGVGGDDVTVSVSAADVTAGSVTIAIPGDNTTLDDDDITITIVTDGATALLARTLSVAVNLTLGGTSGPTANSRGVQGVVDLTVWDLNGTVLIANFANGNNSTFNTRIYLFNPTNNAGNITVQVLTLPLSGASTSLGTVSIGNLEAGSGRNIRLAEDILTPLSITLPYTADGGNLVLEITIEAESVNGVAQVFQLDLSSFGIYPLPAL